MRLYEFYNVCKFQICSFFQKKVMTIFVKKKQTFLTLSHLREQSHVDFSRKLLLVGGWNLYTYCKFAYILTYQSLRALVRIYHRNLNDI